MTVYIYDIEQRNFNSGYISTLCPETRLGHCGGKQTNFEIGMQHSDAVKSHSTEKISEDFNT